MLGKVPASYRPEANKDPQMEIYPLIARWVVRRRSKARSLSPAILSQQLNDLLSLIREG